MLLGRFPRANVWVHERGAPHLIDPSRLVSSTARTYGEDRMLSFFGSPEPVDPARIRAVVDGDVIPLGGRDLEVLYTPGHASHHVALADSATGAVFTGEAIGSHLPWVDVLSSGAAAARGRRRAGARERRADPRARDRRS